ncbi:archease [Candidatus Woesearchaeota archaeon]|nr:archease [Candidatus Woesearchaeota archaeon]
MKKFKYLEHTADIKFQAFGDNLEKAFENSALAMFNAMYSGKIKPIIKKKIMVSGRDLENLLYNFLEEFLFLLDSEGFFLSKIAKIKLDKKKLELEAELIGDKAENYKIGLDVKAVTYNSMFVKKEKDKWVCQVLIDV